MAARMDNKEQKRWTAQGLSSIAPELGLQILEKLMAQDIAQIGVCPINWPRFLHSFPIDAPPPLLANIERHIKDQQPAAKRLELLHQLQEASLEERHSLIMTYIQTGVAKALGFSISELDVHQPLNNMGLDSLMAIELRNRMMTELGMDIPMEKFIEGPSIAQIADLLIEQLALENILLVEPTSATPSEDMEEITI
jgi:acyl carrier protein